MRNEGKFYFSKELPKDWVVLDDIPLTLQWPIIISEDWAFFQHSGVDYQQMSIVFEHFKRHGYFPRGASTITQQLIKNLYLSKKKTIKRKIDEALLVFLLEKLTSKQWILEQYFNVIELGPDIYGLKSGVDYYFQCDVSDPSLTYRHGAFLAMLLPSPIRYGQSFREKRLTSFAREQLEHILSKLVMAKKITPSERAELLELSFEWEESTGFRWEDIAEDEGRLEQLPYSINSESGYEESTWGGEQIDDDTSVKDNQGYP